MRITAAPNGCQHCGIPEHEHMQQWKPEPTGWHTWAQPTQQQILERMRARRAGRQRAALRRIENALWARMQQVIEQLGRGYRGSSRSRVEYTPADNGTNASCTYDLWEQDGTTTEHAITAAWNNGEITVDVQRTVNSRDEVWGPDGTLQQDGSARLIVIDHCAYEIRPEHSQSGFRGFCGRRFDIEFLADGRTVTTTNLWHIGPVPPKWRQRWPDTARFTAPATA